MRHDDLRFVLVISLAFMLAACAGDRGGSTTQTTCPASIEAPVLYPGDTWTFRKEDGNRWRQTYTARTADGLLYGLGPKAKANYFYDQAHTVRKVIHQEMELTQATPDFPEIGYVELDFPLTLGKTWTNTHYSDMRVLIRDGFHVAGCEQVTVVAGTFFAVRIEVSQIYTQRAGSAGRDFTLWYAPAVKYWVKRVSGHATFWTPVSGWELESFRIDAGKPKPQ